jgi:hypothetical protein
VRVLDEVVVTCPRFVSFFAGDTFVVCRLLLCGSGRKITVVKN